jgi:predicted permease
VVRDSRASARIETVWQDVRFSLRVLRKSPGFTGVVVLTLALGIGENTAIFSLVNAVLLQMIPVKHAEELVVLHWSAHRVPDSGGMSSFGDCVGEASATTASGCSLPSSFFHEVEKRQDVLANAAAFAGPANMSVLGNGLASIARVELVGGSYFGTLGVPAAMGRTLTAADDQKGAPAVAVLDYGYWQKAFGGAPNVVGKTLGMNKEVVTIVGVADQGFTRLTPGRSVDLYMPLAQEKAMEMGWSGEEKDGGSWWLTVVARLHPGVKRSQAEAALNVVFQNAVTHGPKPAWKTGDEPRLELIPAQHGLAGFRMQLGEPLRLLMAAVGIVLLIACANVAGLMLARSTSREREMAVRLALGASRRRVIQQVLTESLLLSVAGAVLGMLLAYEGASALAAFTSANWYQPLQIDVRPDARVLLFTIGAALVTGIGFGMVPALRGARTRAALEFGRGTTSGVPQAAYSRRRRRLGLSSALVMMQVALSIVMLTGGGLLLRTLDKLRSIDAGFDTRNILLLWIDPTLAGYEKGRLQDLYENLQQRLAAVPGVTSVSYSSDALLDGDIWTEDVKVQGQTNKQTVESQMLRVGPKYFETMRMPLLRGRALGVADIRSGPPAAVVNQAFVRKFMEGRDPLGVYFGPDQSKATEKNKAPQWTIIGVVRDAKYSSLQDEVAPTAYVPLTEGGAAFALRAASGSLVDSVAMTAAVRKTVSDLDENLPVMRMQTQSDTIDRLLFNQRLLARLLGVFATLGLGLACIGLYGLLSYEVAARTREIGVRMALGAQRKSVLGLILRRGLVMVLLGLAVGVGAAALTTRLLASVLYGVKPLDPLTFVSVAMLLAGVGLAACFLPAWRALHVDPVVALRYE